MCALNVLEIVVILEIKRNFQREKIQFFQLFYSDPCLIAGAQGCTTEFACCFTKP